MFAQCAHDISLANGLALSLFLAGLFGGVTHCAGMCGPFVLAQVRSVEDRSGAAGFGVLRRLAGTALIPYHLGRITTYTAMAVLLNTVVNLAFLYSSARTLVVAPMLMTAGVIFLVSAFPKASSLFPWVRYIHAGVPGRLFSRIAGMLSNDPGMVKRFFLGLLLGFMPCGLVVSALMAAATADLAIQAAFAMAAFGAGTAVSLVPVGWGGGALMRAYPAAGARVRQGAMALSAVWLFFLAGRLVF